MSATSLLDHLGTMIRKIAPSCRKNSLLTRTFSAVAAAVGVLEEDDFVLGGGRWKYGRCAANVEAFVGRMTTFETRPRDGTRSSRDPFGSLVRRKTSKRQCMLF